MGTLEVRDNILLSYRFFERPIVTLPIVDSVDRELPESREVVGAIEPIRQHLLDVTYGELVAWLKEHGDPYTVSIVDADGRVGIDFGVYGVPETFLIDQNGVIRFKHIGPLTPKVLKEFLLPKVKELLG